MTLKENWHPTRVKMVDGIVSANIFHIFSESDCHYFLKMRSNFGIKASIMIRWTSAWLNILLVADKTTPNAPAWFFIFLPFQSTQRIQKLTYVTIGHQPGARNNYFQGLTCEILTETVQLILVTCQLVNNLSKLKQVTQTGLDNMNNLFLV